MATEMESPEFGFGPRTTPDLVASSEVLHSVLLGMDSLRRRLQVAQAERAKRPEDLTSRAEQTAATRPATAPSLAGAESETASEGPIWFYATTDSAVA